MMLQKIHVRFFILLSLLLVVLVCVNISLGSVDIPALEVFNSIVGASSKSSWDYIITNYRLPKAITAIIAGGGLAISGLLMQTLFRNPLAGPFVLGLSSGASLGVAILILGAGAISGVFSSFLLMTPKLKRLVYEKVAMGSIEATKNVLVYLHDSFFVVLQATTLQVTLRAFKVRIGTTLKDI